MRNLSKYYKKTRPFETRKGFISVRNKQKFKFVVQKSNILHSSVELLLLLVYLA